MRFRMRLKIGDNIVGRHRMTIDGKSKVIRPGDIIECEKSSLQGVIDKFEQLDPEPEAAVQQPRVKLVAVKRPGNNFTGYDVVNEATGKAINTKKLKKAEALAMVEQGLEAGDGDGKDSDIDSDTDENLSSGGDSNSGDE